MAQGQSPLPSACTFMMTKPWNPAPVKDPIFGSTILKFKRRVTNPSVLNKPRHPPFFLSRMHSLPFRSPTGDRISASTEGERTGDSWVDRAIHAQ